MRFTNKEIAARLHISLFTTKEYVSNVLEKTGLPNRAAVATTYAMNLGDPVAPYAAVDFQSVVT